ncbi:MAG: hypothetical protein KDA79_20045 [Planctomycetaceae bacterium]|nr:hypothetical protein [Planctomycetaceae bacterium]
MNSHPQKLRRVVESLLAGVVYAILCIFAALLPVAYREGDNDGLAIVILSAGMMLSPALAATIAILHYPWKTLRMTMAVIAIAFAATVAGLMLYGALTE